MLLLLVFFFVENIRPKKLVQRENNRNTFLFLKQTSNYCTLCTVLFQINFKIP